VIVVGAGPAGLLLALLLAQNGIPTTLLEKSTEIDRNPRASHYSSPSIYELRRAGIMEDIMRHEQTFVPNGVAWRHIDSTEICRIMSSNPPGQETMVSLPLHELLPIIAAHLAGCPQAKVLLDHEVLAAGQDEAGAWLQVKTPGGEKRFEASYVVGCDGANSKIRRELFGSNFPGFTWDKQIVATNVRILFV
jgi:2-polyprenyl-6-methoxyphenol hydroxylase-like FAD-dependent oxidoreductase